MVIYNKDGTQFCTVEVSDDSYRQKGIMDYNMLVLHVSLPETKIFPVGCYCFFRGEKYTLMRKPNFSRRHDREIAYTLTMYTDDYRAHTTMFRHCVGAYTGTYMSGDDGDGRLTFTLTETAKGHLQMLVDNLNCGMSADDMPWTIGECVDWDGTTDSGTEKLISYDFVYCIDALQLIAKTFEVEYSFNGRVVSLGKLEKKKDAPLAMSYGRGNGFLPGTGCSTSGDLPPVERVYIQGGEQNIDPSKYGKTEANGEGSRTLLLPKNGAIWYDGTNFYKDVSDGLYPASARRYVVSSDRRSVMRSGRTKATVDASFDATDIYPMRVGTVSMVEVKDGVKNLIDIYDNSSDFPSNFADLGIGGVTPTIIFQSGDLAGREFDINSTEARIVTAYVSGKGWRIEIVPVEIDGVWMPGGTAPEGADNSSYTVDQAYMPKVGDKYAIFGIQLPQSYFNDGNLNGAEWDMMRKAVKHLYDHEDEEYTFSGDVDGKWAKSNWDEDGIIAGGVGQYMELGYHIMFNDDNIPEGILLRVTAIKEYVNSPYKPHLTLSNALISTSIGSTIKQVSRVERFDSRIRREIERMRVQASRESVCRFDSASAMLRIGSRTFQMADPTLTPAQYTKMISSFQTINDKMIDNGWLEDGYCDGQMCYEGDKLEILGTPGSYPDIAAADKP